MSKLGKVGPYTLLERLGRGGMGEVYLASARRGERVAVKVLHDLTENDAARIRLEREVRALRRVESPYVARVLDADLSCDRPYLVMEHIEGVTLLERVRQDGALDLAELVRLAQGIAAALAIIHAAGVVHRDLKPANIIMGAGGPVLIDFGIAQVHDATRLTLTGTFLGTPGYTAPEIFADEQVDSPADVHAWAATVAFAATGRPAFGRGTAEAQMYAVLNGQADLKGVPVELLPLVRAALNREPRKRPTAALLADRLARLVKASGLDDPDAGAGEPGDASRPGGNVPSPRGRGSEPAARGRSGEVPAPRGRSGDSVPPRSRTGEGAASRAEGGRGRSGDSVPPRSRAGEVAARAEGVRGRSADSAPSRSRTGEAAARADGARGRAGEVPAPRGRATDEGTGRGRADGTAGRGRADGAAGRGKSDGAAGRGRADGAVGHGKTDGATGRGRADGAAGRGKSDGTTGRGRSGEGAVRARAQTAARTRTRTQSVAKGVKSRAEGATTLPAGNTALLLLAVLAVPCVVASVMWPIASIGITAVFVVLTRALWMSHWMVRNHAEGWLRATMRAVTLPFALSGALASAAVWPGAPVAVAAGGALWITGGGHIDSTWWQQPAPVTAAAVVFGMLCGGITGREIERVGARLPELRREGLRALAVLGGFVALCAAAVRAIALLL
ncbi:serine/threonine protein kinase [Nonomuraea sp. C10]|uniref:serine/threonine protein kinase n=1 Tax=Nonomuraea sp. C10 TaxID=2600577 RepID=UPI0011CEAADB|nr:serine/threonine protein kinase [Nonomuraea sp. C10]TXK39167.1 protein kinase [Nonomuraea sp. C10]